MSIGDLPFTSDNDSNDRMSGFLSYIGAFTGLQGGQVILYNTTNQTQVYLYDANTTYNTVLTEANVNNNTHLRAWISYHSS